MREIHQKSPVGEETHRTLWLSPMEISPFLDALPAFRSQKWGIMGIVLILSPEVNTEFSKYGSGSRLRATKGNLESP